MTPSRHQEDLLDEALEETFPSSDVPQIFQPPPSARTSAQGAVFKRLLLATDLSERCSGMISRGIAIAQAFDASIDLVHVCESSGTIHQGSPVVRDEQRRAVLESIDRALADAAQRIIDAGVPCQTTSLAGSPSREIVAHARKTGADLVLLGSHGHQGLLHSLRSNIAKRIARTAPCAVLVVPVLEPAPPRGHHEGRSA